MYPVSQSKSWLQSSVGMTQVSSGGVAPIWLYRDKESGILISEVYLHTFFQCILSFYRKTYFHCPSKFLIKQFGTPYHVAVLPVGDPKTGW